MEVTAPPYTHTGLENTVDYYFVVTAVSGDEESVASAEVTAFPHLAPQRTGQNASYAVGDDGDVQAGRIPDFSGPAPDDTYSADYLTTDHATGLVWKSCSEGLSGASCTTGSLTLMNWTDASAPGSGCDVLNSANSGAGYGGRTDWQLPEIDELQTLINYGTYAPAIYNADFPATGPSFYWTATPEGTLSWTVDFDAGALDLDQQTDGFYVRCLSMGTATLVSHAYHDNDDGSVTDKATGLTWQKCSRGVQNDASCSGTIGGAEWPEALDYCNSLDLAGRSWRLPNMNELKSLVDYSISNPAINSAFFPGLDAERYWSSTTSSADSNVAWTIRFDIGRTATVGKNNFSAVRCVSD